tara:strand:- start:1448 stop:1588 length:141 start_codon:yes stop_codon:yes gene_type:complete
MNGKLNKKLRKLSKIIASRMERDEKEVYRKLKANYHTAKEELGGKT